MALVCMTNVDFVVVYVRVGGGGGGLPIIIKPHSSLIMHGESVCVCVCGCGCVNTGRELCAPVAASPSLRSREREKMKTQHVSAGPGKCVDFLD